MSKVLVLGAGASCAYGFPLGGELRKRILEISPRQATSSGIIGDLDDPIDVRKLTSFIETFRHSQMYSIDAFLGRRPEFGDIGKKCIAHCLLKREQSVSLFSETATKDHWYQHLFNHLARNDWDDLTFSDLSIVTFNYDRSLEHFLHVALQNAYDKSAQESREKIEKLRIVHVYGSLCSSLPDSEGYLSYDGKVNPHKISKASEGIVVIPEGRADNPTWIKAREWLSNARAICFLGFGFDPLNVERLSQGGACESWKQLPSGHTRRRIVGTCIGMTGSEMNSAYGTLTQEALDDVKRERFQPVNCTQLLRETLFLQ